MKCVALALQQSVARHEARYARHVVEVMDNCQDRKPSCDDGDDDCLQWLSSSCRAWSGAVVVAGRPGVDLEKSCMDDYPRVPQMPNGRDTA